MKVISYSLWGSSPKYCVGAIKNAELAKSIYPGWTARFYVGTSVPTDTKVSLERQGAEVIEMKEPGDWTSMFWRFEAASDSKVDVMLSRDADSRINLREAEAVDVWMKSDAQFHIMRDHPAHATEILGGMWGVKSPLLRDMTELLREYKRKGNFWQVDQNFLREVVYNRVRNISMVHDPYFEKKPFPTKRVDYEFVGDVFDENDIRHPQYWLDVKSTPGLEP